MRRILPLLLVALGLVAVIRLAWVAPRRPAAEARPDGPASSPERTADPRAGELEATETRVPAELQANETKPSNPADAPALLADPTEQELARFARLCPPGTIEGIVLRGLEPVEGGWAWLGAQSLGGLPWGPPEVWDAAASVSRAPIGPDGVFRFSSLAPDTYGVGVRTPEGTARHVYVTLRADTSTPRIRIVLGAGGIRGRVYDEHAAAAVGWHVAVNNYGNTLAGTQVIAGRETDAQGAFEFGDLVGGSYVLSAGPVPDRREPRTRTLYLELPQGEWKTVDVGTPRGGSIWTGHVLLPRGEPLRLMALTELRIESGDARENAALSSEGGFRAQVRAGTHRLALFAYSRSGGVLVPLGELTLPGHDLEQDIPLPRAFLRVRATYRGSRGEPEAALSALSTWLEGSGRILSGVRGRDRSECFLAVAPGEYVLSSHPPLLGAPGGQLPVRIREQDDEVALDVVIGDP